MLCYVGPVLDIRNISVRFYIKNLKKIIFVETKTCSQGCFFARHDFGAWFLVIKILFLDKNK